MIKIWVKNFQPSLLKDFSFSFIFRNFRETAVLIKFYSIIFNTLLHEIF